MPNSAQKETTETTNVLFTHSEKIGATLPRLAGLKGEGGYGTQDIIVQIFGTCLMDAKE